MTGCGLEPSHVVKRMSRLLARRFGCALGFSTVSEMEGGES